MINLTRILLFLATLFFFVNADQNIIDIKTNTDILGIQDDFIDYSNLKQQLCNYVGRVKHFVANAQNELKANSDCRPSTEYSVQDILFIARQYLPSWVYPESVWKEDPVTRRRHISKVLHSTPVSVRPRVIAIRDDAVAWAKSSRYVLGHNYIISTINSFDSLIKFAENFVTTAVKDDEFTDPLSLAADYAVLEDTVNHFVMENKHAFAAILQAINHEFNDLATFSGDLRISLESVRSDAIQHTKRIHDDLFATDIDHRLYHLAYHIRNEIQNLSEDLHAIPEEDKVTPKALRNHAANLLHSDIKSLDDIRMTLARSKAYIDQTWDNALNELIQGPTSVYYWADMAVEVREAAVNFGKRLAKKIQQRRQYTTCQCGHRF